MSSIRPLFRADTIRHEVRALARRIQEDLPDRSVLVLALASGSIPFFADFVRSVSRPIRFDFVAMDRRADPERAFIDYLFRFPEEIEGRTVVLLRELVCSGVIEQYLVAQAAQYGAVDIKVAALIDLVGERSTPFEPDYTVFKLERRGFLVGYGLKKAGEGGNLPYLGWMNLPSSTVSASSDVVSARRNLPFLDSV